MRTARYQAYSEHLVKKYGEKVYKLPVNLAGTCPNRDGTLGTGGCIFCDEKGAGFQCLPGSMGVSQQIATNRDYFRRRFKAGKFIVYFQAFTNTYMPFDEFCEIIAAAAEEEDIVGISISTRPDCVNDRYLDYLLEVRQKKGLEINIELGLQTVNYHTLNRVKRGHTLAEFVDAVLRANKRGFAICAHLILNLPWDDDIDAVEGAKLLTALSVEYIKLHSLYVVRGTILGEMYERGEFEIIPLQEYVRRVALFLEYLHPAIVIQRLVGKGPADSVLFSNWGVSWWVVKQNIDRYLEDHDIYQGKKFNYLNGKGLLSYT